MICSGGLRILMSTTIQKLLPFDFIGPVVGDILDLVSVLFGCLFFAGAYMLIPNTKVNFRNALITWNNRRHRLSGASMAFPHRPDLCCKIQCNLRKLLIPAIDVDMDAIFLAHNTRRSAHMPLFSGYIPVFIRTTDQQNLRCIPTQGHSCRTYK